MESVVSQKVVTQRAGALKETVTVRSCELCVAYALVREKPTTCRQHADNSPDGGFTWSRGRLLSRKGLTESSLKPASSS